METDSMTNTSGIKNEGGLLKQAAYASKLFSLAAASQGREVNIILNI